MANSAGGNAKAMDTFLRNTRWRCLDDERRLFMTTPENGLAKWTSDGRVRARLRSENRNGRARSRLRRITLEEDGDRTTNGARGVLTRIYTLRRVEPITYKGGRAGTGVGGGVCNVLPLQCLVSTVAGQLQCLRVRYFLGTYIFKLLQPIGCTRTFTQTRTHAHARKRTHVRSHKYIRAHTHKHAYMHKKHTHTCARARTHARTYTQSHTRARARTTRI